MVDAGTGSRTARRAGTAPRRIDIVVPVYNAPDDVARCVDSVLRHTEARHRLTLIDDASPDARIVPLLESLAARDPRVQVLRNAQNLGFTGTANRGMALSRDDVVLLNSDTLVSEGWLEALVRCADSDPSIGTITPFSNNAEILSWPRFCEDNAWPEGADPTPVARAFARFAVPSYPDLPTGVGFCFYVRRALLDAIGTFDTVFGAGYGEENDFCLRAAAHGWRNVAADDAFVAHTGARSFSASKQALVARNSRILAERHPGYDAMVQRYIAADPLRPLREAARSAEGALASPGLGVLHVIHHHGGGTEAHVRTLVDASRGRRRHFLAVAVGERWQVEEHRADGSVASYAFARRAGERWDAFVGGLCASFSIGLVHLHNISACREGILEALRTLDLPFGYTVHDLNFACPTITFLDDTGRYCGAVTDDAACARCLGAQRAFAGIDIAAWREAHRTLVARAAFVIAPSQWAADTFARYFGRVPVVVAHGVTEPPPVPPARLALPLPRDGARVVAVLGAVGPDKGARRLENLVALAREARLPLRFVLIGYLDREHGPWQSGDAAFTVHGRYAPGELPALLRDYGVDLVLFPSEGPETFSFTLSEAWAAGLPALVPPIGALAERARETGAAEVMTEGEWRDDARMLGRVAALVSARWAPASRARRRVGPRARRAPARRRGHGRRHPGARRHGGTRARSAPRLRAARRRARTRCAGVSSLASARRGRGGTARAAVAAHPRRPAGDAPPPQRPRRAALRVAAAVAGRRAEGEVALMALSYDDWKNRAREHLDQGRVVDAFACFGKASRMKPNAPAPHMGMAEALWRLDRPAQALATWRALVQRKPDYLPAWMALAEASALTRDLGGAREAATQVLAVQPREPRLALIGAGASLADAARAPSAARELAELHDDPSAVALLRATGGPCRRAGPGAPRSRAGRAAARAHRRARRRAPAGARGRGAYTSTTGR